MEIEYLKSLSVLCAINLCQFLCQSLLHFVQAKTVTQDFLYSAAVPVWRGGEEVGETAAVDKLCRWPPLQPAW